MASTSYRSFEQHLDPAVGPKRILALDGGGIRGVLTVGILKRIEDLLRERFGGDPDFRLSDYFDLIGGTSTGAIIAAGLALGMSVDEIRDHYFKLGDAIFKRSLLRMGLIRRKFDADKVSKALKGVFGDRTLASSDFRTGLMVMAKRMDTGSPWPLTNNPKARYFGKRPNSDTIPNGEYPLWKVVRASTAAPYYFDPEKIVIKNGDRKRGLKRVQGEFIDGGVSTANNPALSLLMMATVEGYNFGWRTGKEEMLVVSVGTGRNNPEVGTSDWLKGSSLVHAMRALASVMDDCGELVETVMQWLSQSPTARMMDREMGAVTPSLNNEPLLSYLRYNVFFEPEWMKEALALRISAKEADALTVMDKPANMPHLDKIGIVAGRALVKEDHFPTAFDLR